MTVTATKVITEKNITNLAPKSPTRKAQETEGKVSPQPVRNLYICIDKW